MKKETKEKIEQLQSMEQNINSIIAQKQQFQAQQMEVDNALSQVKKTDKVFRIIGNIMVASSKTTVKKELSEKKELVDLRLKTMDKQEDKLRDKAAEIQKEVMKDIKWLKMSDQVEDIIDVLTELLEDNTVPKNVKIKIESIINSLKQDSELSLKVNQALSILDEISDDNNIQPYTRTQIWNIASMLESLS